MVSRVVGLLIVFPLLTCCAGSAPEVPVIRLAHAPHDHHSALYVAAGAPDHFREHGDLYLREVEERQAYLLISGGRTVARVEVSSSAGGDRLIRRLAEDQVDVAFGSFPGMLHYIDAGYPLRVIAPVMAGGNALVVRPDLPVDSWQELTAHLRRGAEPLRIGYKGSGAVQLRVLEAALAEEKIPFSRDLREEKGAVVLVDLHGAENLIPALRNGLVDGFVVMQPLAARAEAEGAGKVIAWLSDLATAEARLAYPCCALGAREDLLRRHPGAVEDLLVILLRANRLLAGDPRGFAPIVAAWLGVTSDVEARALPTIRFLVDLDARWTQGTRRWLRAMAASGELKGRLREGSAEEDPAERVYAMDLFRRARARL